MPDLRSHLDAYARERLTLADFDPVLHYDTELPLSEITQEMFQLISRMEPFGMGNPEPVFVAPNVRLAFPHRVLKEKHVKLKLSECPPAGTNPGAGKTFSALGWHMAESFQNSQLLPGDSLSIAYTLEDNDHPDYGGLELRLKDFQSVTKINNKTFTAVEGQ